MSRSRCVECGGSSLATGTAILHSRTCPRARAALLSMIGFGGRSIQSLRSQSERESALRRAICGACPHVPFGFVSGVVSQMMQIQLEAEEREAAELSAKGQSR